VAVDLRVAGAERLAVLGRELRAAGASGLRRELYRSVRRTVRDSEVRPQVARSAQATLPQRGGLAARVAAAKVTARIRAGGQNVGVDLVASDRRADLHGINAGRVRHPVYGHGPWVSQAVRPGYFDQAMEGPVVDSLQEAVIEAVDTIARRLSSG
jgi:hypothetical protein